ncbi:MAG: CDP-alcohol phosphatidyltransferase family protein [Christensenellaceae bacterium]|jgi:CDP-diacylglycerol--glycerol-3-phosphate 3-phosphatidyltransferase|nr:CDP-alcohol phosphatidyltransferase family protein [Christensenellaceae bacterium]
MKINTATKITIVRIALLPFILAIYLMSFYGVSAFITDYGRLIAMALFIIAAASDFVDGYIARKYNQVTDLGKLLDPIADKLLSFLGFILIVCDPILNNGSAGLAFGENVSGILPLWLGVLAISIATMRDYIVNAIRQIGAQKGLAVAAIPSSKIKSTAQYFAISFFMLYSFSLGMDFLNGWLKIVVQALCLAFLILATALSFYTIFDFPLKNKHVFAAKKEETNAK